MSEKKQYIIAINLREGDNLLEYEGSSNIEFLSYGL